MQTIKLDINEKKGLPSARMEWLNIIKITDIPKATQMYNEMPLKILICYFFG